MKYSPQHHPEETLLAEFAAGVLPPAQAIAVSAHLHYCPASRQKVRDLEALGGALLEREKTSQPELDQAFTKLLQCIYEHTDVASEAHNEPHHKVNAKHADLPKALQKLLSQQTVNWKRVTSTLKTAPLVTGQEEYCVSLQKIAAGGRVPHHDHGGREITVVLRGSFSDEDGVYQPGDFIERQDGDAHRPMASSNEDCLCLSVEEAPVKLTGILGWLINPFIRIQPG